MAVTPKYLEWVGGNALEQRHEGKFYCHNNYWMMTPFNCEAIHLRILVSFPVFFFIFDISLELFLLGYCGNYIACCLAKGRDFWWFILVTGLYVRRAEVCSVVFLLCLMTDPAALHPLDYPGAFGLCSCPEN